MECSSGAFPPAIRAGPTVAAAGISALAFAHRAHVHVDVHVHVHTLDPVDLKAHWIGNIQRPY
jgi:hypothetical protein